MTYTSKIADLLRRGPFSDMGAKMLPQTDPKKYGQKLLEHHPIESKVEVESYGMALEKI